MLKFTEAEIKDMKAMRAGGYTYAQVAKEFDISTPTATKYIKMPGKKVKKQVKAIEKTVEPRRICEMPGCERPAFAKVVGEWLCGVHMPATPSVDLTKGKKSKPVEVGQIIPALSNKPWNELTPDEQNEAQKRYDEAMKATPTPNDFVVPEPNAALQEAAAKLASKVDELGGFVKHDDGKEKIAKYLPLFKGAIDVMNYGAKKYSEDGWKTGTPDLSRYIEALFRHAWALSQGEDLDESGFHHADHVIANAGIIRTLVTEGLCHDDRPGKQPQPT